MALCKTDTQRVASAMDMLVRALMVDDNRAVIANLQKSRDIIDNLLKSGWIITLKSRDKGGEV